MHIKRHTASRSEGLWYYRWRHNDHFDTQSQNRKMMPNMRCSELRRAVAVAIGGPVAAVAELGSLGRCVAARIMRPFSTLLLALLLLAGCSDAGGRFQSKLRALKPGMPKDQVEGMLLTTGAAQ